MEHTYEEIKKKTVAQLREIAKETDHDALRGYTTMHKEDLIHALCTALGLEEHVRHVVVGIDKGQIKTRIRELKAERDKLLALPKAERDKKRLRTVLRQIHGQKRQIHKATV